MRNKFIIIALFILLATSALVYATDWNLPLGYINNLRTCTKSFYKRDFQGFVMDYTIKGKVSNDRCEVYVSDYLDFSNMKMYKEYVSFNDEVVNGLGSSFAKNEGKTWENVRLPSQQKMIEKAKKEAMISVCRFNKSERELLYNAYPKNYDNTSKMRTYYDLENDLFNNGPCIIYEGSVPAVHKEKIYYCEYADMSCYYKPNSGRTLRCSKDLKGAWSAALGKVKSHVEAGLCQQVF